jgi:hypothetical protein
MMTGGTLDIARLDPRLLLYIAIGAMLAAAAVYGYLRYGRRAALRRLKRTVSAACQDMMMDVLVPDGMDGHLHVDFLLLTQRGILVLDLRETAGMIFGGDQMDEWTVMARNRRYSFANPQGGLYDRVAAVRLLAGDTPVEGRVLFTTRARFPKGRPRSVLMLDVLQGEYAPVEAAAMLATVARFQADWERVKAAVQPSDLKRYR